jgi:hypothetical protein
MDPSTSALAGQRIHDSTAQFSRWRWVEISLGIAALARPDKVYAVGNVPAARSFMVLSCWRSNVSRVHKSFCQTIQLRAERSALPQLQASRSATQPSSTPRGCCNDCHAAGELRLGNPEFEGSFQLHGFNNNMTFS